MKKILFVIVIILTLNGYSQSPKIQANMDEINKCIEALDKSLTSPNWSDEKFTTDFKTNKDKIYSRIRNIVGEDAKFDVSGLEKKYDFYSLKYKEGREQAKAAREKTENAVLSAKFLLKDEGITNKVHEKYVGKIVFSNSEISKENPDEAKFGNTFSISSQIYLRIFLKTSIFNEVQSNRSSQVFDNQVEMLYKIYLDGVQAGLGRVEIGNEEKKFLTTEQIKTNTSISGAFNFNKDALLSSSYIDALKSSDAKLTDGKHSLKVELYPIYNSIKPLSETPMAFGEITLNVAKGFVSSANPAICLPKAVKKDAALEAKYKDCVKKYLVNNGKDAVMKSFVLLSSDWEIHKDDITGKPVYRTMYGAAGLSYKDGKCKYETFSFTQNWSGGAYSNVIETSSTGQNGDIFCDCLK